MEWRECFRTPIEAEAHLVQGFLRSRGIPCLLLNGRFTAQPLTFGALGELRILVPEEWLNSARSMIQERLAGRSHEPRS
jgi:hypothetical protein